MVGGSDMGYPPGEDSQFDHVTVEGSQCIGDVCPKLVTLLIVQYNKIHTIRALTVVCLGALSIFTIIDLISIRWMGAA
jgi:hypothetical protein